jgi:hypothetical protein
MWARTIHSLKFILIIKVYFRHLQPQFPENCLFFQDSVAATNRLESVNHNDTTVLLCCTSARSSKLCCIAELLRERRVTCDVLSFESGDVKVEFPHERFTVLQNGDKVTVGATASTVSACAGYNLQLITCHRLSQHYVYTQQNDIRLL